MKRWTRIALCLLLGGGLCQVVKAQWTEQSSGTRARLRGVSVVSERVVWASGSEGTYVKTIDGGATWRAATVPGAESLDFRDVEAFDEQTAYLLSIGEGEKSRIYKTVDGGRNWQLQFTNRNPQGFFDAIAFWDSRRGIAMSDPVDGRFLIIRTDDGGATWKEVPAAQLPSALPGEAAFAASGSCLTVQGRDHVWIATGGGAARVLRSADGGMTWQAATTPITSGQPSAGIFSIAFKDAMNGIVVGGDYTKVGEARDNVALTADGGRTWSLSKSLPGGFRSAAAYRTGANSSDMIVVGPAGTDSSADHGATWTKLGESGYHAVSFKGAFGWAVGEGGRIARFSRP
ncbi:MAG TPA: oxidoreductase [Blastocatellia bacterium]|nr:oxidoreductase [Blastocatellia bacterium]